ncbi:RICIN domain-containing protein [Anaerotruncus rubiinfantis]|uniref:RICIN domain-containing protein n=1 Tax=Anaerotruncus rubiinfantis TaxID=1720200 RepID=UPI00082C53CA|nr:RICIN domain-containing protein [Anaerotruncus rubiinfantis]
MSDRLYANSNPTGFEPFPMNGTPNIYEAAVPGSQLLMENAPAGHTAEFPLLGSDPQLASQQVTMALPASMARAVVNATGGIAPESGVNYCLRNAKSGLYLTAASAEEGANCVQNAFTGEESQVWFLYKAAGSNYFQLIPRVASGKRLTVIPGGTASGANVGISAGSSTPPTSQEWTVTLTSRGSYKLLSRCSNNAQALCVDPNNMDLDGGNVAQYAYTDNATTNDEWVFEPFLSPFMEYDQGYFMYHSGYSSLAIQQRLKVFADDIEDVLYSEFGLRCRPFRNIMIPSLADDCTSILYTCSHGSREECTNTYDSEEDHIHHLNWSKQIHWYVNRGRQPNGLHILWQGHPKCIQLTTSSGLQHTYFQLAERYYYASSTESPFMLMNLPLNVNAKQMVALLLSGISNIFGANTNSHNANCIADPNCNTQTIYDRVLGPSPTLSSFWCNSCRQHILDNIDRFSKSAP